MTDLIKCQQCGHVLQDGTARILMGFSVNELLELAFATADPVVRKRIALAVQLLDPDAADGILAHHEALK